MSSTAHELRVLDGLHAGARAPLPDGAAVRLAIGSALDNDIVLSDPGIGARHAQLIWDGSAGHWQLQPAGAAPASQHPLGEAVALGPVRLTVAAANQPFELPPPLPSPAAANDAGDDAASTRGEPGPEAASDGDAGPPLTGDSGLEAGDRGADGPSNVDLTATGTPPRRWAWLLALGSLLLLMLVAVGLWRFATGAHGIASPPAVSVTSAVAPGSMASTAGPTPRAAVRAVLQAQGLADRLQLGGSDTHPVVSGLLADAGALEQLAAALARLRPRPGLKVWTPDDVRAALREAGVALPPGAKLAADDPGVLVLGGPVTSPAVAQALLDHTRRVLPPGVVLRDRLQTPARLAEQALADARAQGFVVDGGFDGRQLRLNLRLADADRPRWERGLRDWRARTAGVLPFTATLQPEPPAAPATTVVDANGRLPFDVRSIVGGAQPYVLLADGTRLLPGAQHGGVTLLRIDDDRLHLQRGTTLLEVRR